MNRQDMRDAFERDVADFTRLQLEHQRDKERRDLDAALNRAIGDTMLSASASAIVSAVFTCDPKSAGECFVRSEELRVSAMLAYAGIHEIKERQ